VIRLSWAALGVLVACRPASAPPLTVERHAEPGGLRLVLRPGTGARINARLKPALELADGTVLRFDTARLSPDSAYFAEAPELTLPAGASAHGRLRASVCNEGEHICRLITLEVS
jgi:hypothetical protein